MEGVHPKCLEMRTRGEGYHTSCVRMQLHYLFPCFCFMVSYGVLKFIFICRKGMFVRNGYFSPMRSIFVVMK